MTRLVAALEMGGTHVSAGRVDLCTARVDAARRVALPADAGEDVLLGLIVDALADAAEGVERIGVAAPGPFDYGGGIPWLEHKLAPLFGVDLRRALSSRLGFPPAAILFLNDAEAFAVGEWWAGEAAGHRRVVGVTLGTGLGSAFVEDGRPVRVGPRVPPEGALYLLTFRGARVEETIARDALIARYGEPGLDVEEIAGRARAGDLHARNAFVDLASALGEVLEPWLRAFEATCLVVGGSIARAWDLLEPALRESLRGVEGLDTIAPSARLDDAALLGAAHHAADASRVARRAPHAMHPQVARLRRERIAAGARPLHELTVAEARAVEEAVAPATDVAADEIDVVDLCGPVPIRLFRPTGRERLPVCVWLPGGGWVLDTRRASDAPCRRIAAGTPCGVAVVRYRLAPEHPFPAALQDCVDAVQWIVAEGAAEALDPQRLAIGGTSAGANLAAAVALRLSHAEEPPLAAEILIYPPLLYGAETRSMQEEGDWVFLDRRAVEWSWSHYLGAADEGQHPLASPLRARGLERLPATLVLTAELDPLRDEGELYAQRLRAAGVPTELSRFEGMPHGFFSLADQVDAADEAQRTVVSVLRRALVER